MEDGSESGFWSRLNRLFRNKLDLPLEEVILAAKEDGEIKGEDVSMLLKVLKLHDRSVSEVMVPRTDIICAEIDDGIPAVCELITRHGHTRIPIYREDRDHVIGIVHAKDLMQTLIRHEEASTPIEAMMRVPMFVPESKNLKDMLLLFQSSKNHLAIAIDEYGGTSGLVTLEDVLEQIVGEIEDEHDTLKPEEIQSLGGEELLVSGRVPLAELEDVLDLSLDSDQVETIGGYLSELAGRVPDPGESFILEGLRFLVREADAKQVRWIHVQPVREELAEPLLKAEP